MKAVDNKVIDVTVSDMRPGTNVRENPKEDELVGLGESLKVEQIHPVVLFPDHEIFDGWRRWLAAQRVGLPTLKAIVVERPKTQTELLVMQGALSIHRADLTGWEQYQLCYRLVQMNTDWMSKDVAKALHITPSMVTRYLSPSKCIRPVRDALQAGQIGISDCHQLAQVPESEQAELLKLKLAGKSRDELAQIRRDNHPGKKVSDQPRASRLKCQLASGISVTLSGRELTLAEAGDALTEAQRSIKAALAQGLNAKTWQAVMHDKAAKSQTQPAAPKA